MTKNQADSGRSVVENFAVWAESTLGEKCVVVSLLPWSRGRVPAGILAPSLSGTLSVAEIERRIGNRHTVLVPATFETQAEEEAAHQMLPEFSSFDDVCVFLIQLLPESVVPSRESSELIIRRYEAMLATGVDDVFLNPARDAESLRLAINLARATWELNVRRMQLMLDSEPDPVTPKAMRVIQSQHQRMLWECIPAVLMPRFAQLDRHLPESGHVVGDYRFVRRFATVTGTVLQAVDPFNQPVVIKVIDKANVCTPGELEGLYREFRFTSELIKHPNVTRCLGMMHSLSCVYLVFDFAGTQNMMQVASARPGQRVSEKEALDCFQQTASALAYLHDREICHRNVCLPHVIASSPSSPGECVYRLVDFHSAMVAKGQTLSRTICGNLPCIAPEVAYGQPYIPKYVDCWSVGVLLLEIAGGVGSLSRAVQFDLEQDHPQEVACRVQSFFLVPGSHQKALTCLGAPNSPSILEKLQALVCANPAQRSNIRAMVRQRP